MKTLTFLYFGLVLSYQAATQAPHGKLGPWPDGFLAKKTTPAAQHPKRQSSVSNQNVSVITARRVYISPEGREHMRYLDDERLSAIKRADEYSARGRDDLARSVLLDESEICLDQSVYDRLADIDFRIGNFKEAYQILQRIARVDQMPDVMFRASFAAAEAGEVYKGQREYCLREMDHGTTEPSVERREAMPKGETPRDLAVLNCVAVGDSETGYGVSHYSTAEWYFAEAHRLGPPNPYVDAGLGRLLAQKDPWRALQLVEEGKRCRPAKYILSYLDDAKDLAEDTLAKRGIKLPPPPPDGQ